MQQVVITLDRLAGQQQTKLHAVTAAAALRQNHPSGNEDTVRQPVGVVIHAIHAGLLKNLAGFQTGGRYNVHSDSACIVVRGKLQAVILLQTSSTWAARRKNPAQKSGKTSWEKFTR
jgi:hypothetical protein